MLGVCLREHHQLDVGSDRDECAERIEQVVDLVIREREPEVAVRRRERGAPFGKRRHSASASARMMEQRCRLGRSRSTCSVIRSVQRPAPTTIRFGQRAGAFEVYATPRSMRLTAPSPQT